EISHPPRRTFRLPACSLRPQKSFFSVFSQRLPFHSLRSFLAACLGMSQYAKDDTEVLSAFDGSHFSLSRA
ncbi:unnamed protein product, partial [Linum tenue]